MVFRPAHLLCLLLAAPAAASACGVVGETVRLQAASASGEIGLADGRRARLRRPRLGRAGAGARAGRMDGQGAENRLAGAATGSLGPASGRSRRQRRPLAGAGPARARPRPRAAGGRRAAIARPSGWRRRPARAPPARGSGREPAAILDAGDAAALARADGRFVLVAGVVRRVGGTRAKVYLDFAGRDGFAVTVPRKAEPQFRRAGVDLKALAGQRVLVRGVMDVRFGPRIEVADPAMIQPQGKEAGRGG